jgi:teichuronic acid biosynthesis glycosyltransferase TuaG
VELVSIIIPYFKKKFFFYKSFLSAYNQTYKKKEIIIIYDDTDKTDLSYIRNIIKKYKDTKLIINKKNIGAGLSRNKGIIVSKGKYIAFLDSDDLWDKKKLFNQIQFMKKNNAVFSHTSYRILNEVNVVVGRQIAMNNISYYNLLNSCDIGLSTVVVKKDILLKNFFPNLKTKEDYALWLKISKNNKIYGMKKTLSSWRKLENSLSSSWYQKLIDGFNVYYKQEGLNLFISLYRLSILSFFYIFKSIKQKYN